MPSCFEYETDSIDDCGRVLIFVAIFELYQQTLITNFRINHYHHPLMMYHRVIQKILIE